MTASRKRNHGLGQSQMDYPFQFFGINIPATITDAYVTGSALNQGASVGTAVVEGINAAEQPGGTPQAAAIYGAGGGPSAFKPDCSNPKSTLESLYCNSGLISIALLAGVAVVALIVLKEI